MGDIVALKLAKRFGDMTSFGILEAHQYHDYNNNPRKVLFTTETVISRPVKKMILVSKSREKAFIADAVKFDTYEEAKEQGYELPSQWNSELKLSVKDQARYLKFGLSNIRSLEFSDLANYVDSKGKTLLQNIPERNSFIYVDEKQNVTTSQN